MKSDNKEALLNKNIEFRFWHDVSVFNDLYGAGVCSGALSNIIKISVWKECNNGNVRQQATFILICMNRTVIARVKINANKYLWNAFINININFHSLYDRWVWLSSDVTYTLQ